MKRMLIAFLCSAAVGAGCSKSQDEILYVKVSPTIRTRVSALHFDTGDRIGLAVVKGADTWADNRLMTYDGAAFSAPGFIWYDNLDEPSTLTAYYPYSEAGMPLEFTVASDQRNGCTASDLLGAYRTDVTPGTTPVSMLFHHLMSQLTLVVTNASSAKVTGIKVCGFAPTAEVDFAASTATAKSGVPAADIAAFCVREDAAYRVVLVPQRAALTVRVSLDNGRNLDQTLSEAALESGLRYDLAVRVTDENIALTLSGEISDWQDGGSLVDEGALTYEGETYRTVRIGGEVWMAENLRHIPAGGEIGKGVWYPAGGSNVVAEQGLLYDHGFATGNAGATSASVRGICPEGWHIPDRDELATLVGNPELDDDFFCCAGIWFTMTGNYGSSSKGYLMGATVQGAKFDCLSYTSSGEPLVTVLSNGECGVSLRCVKD